jgi:hypothetical protein
MEKTQQYKKPKHSLESIKATLLLLSDRLKYLANTLSDTGKPLTQDAKDLIKLSSIPEFKSTIQNLTYAFMSDDKETCFDIMETLSEYIETH